jgi:hypothetical protein
MPVRRAVHPVLALTIAIAASGVQAFQPLVTDDTGTQGAGGNQLELAGTRDKVGAETGRDVAFVYTRGLMDGLDVFVEIGRQSIDNGTTTEKGPTNPAVGAKWRFYENERKTSLAIKPIYVAPVSAKNETKGMGTGKSSYELSLILTQEMGWGAVHANLLTGRAKYRDTTTTSNENTSQFSVAPVWNASEQFKLAVDLGVISTRAGGTTEKSRFGELGAIYSPNENLDFALGFIREKNRGSGDVEKTATAGVTWRFK